MRIAVACVVVGLVGCAGPRPAPPPEAQVIPPIAWRADEQQRGLVDENWWTAFNDPVLSTLVTTALAGNTDIARASARLQAASAQFRLAQAQQRFNLVAVIEGGRQRDLNPGFGIPELQTTGEAELSLSYDLDLFGRLSRASAASRAHMLSSHATREAVRLSVTALAVSGYIELRSLDARLSVLKETLKAREDALKFARRRAESGYGSQLELKQAEAERYATAQQIPATETAIREQEDALSLLVGDSPRAIERGKDVMSLVPPTVPVALPAAILARRPDIEAAEQELVAADRSLDAARAAFMPQVQIAASGGFVGTTLITDNPVGVFSLGGSILAPLVDRGRLRAQADTSAARRDDAAFAYRQAVLGAFREVENALIEVRNSKTQESLVAAQTDATAQGLKFAQNRFRDGYSPYLEQLDAQRNLLSAQLGLIQAHTDQLTAAVSLYKSLGGGWHMPDDYR